MNAGDLRALKRPLIVLITMVALCTGLIYYLDAQRTVAEKTLETAKTKLGKTRAEVITSGQVKDTIERYLGNYQYLERIGFIGKEQRLSWIESLGLANQKMRLFGVDYNISAQQPYPYASEIGPGQLTMHQSIMKIRLGLLHEGDLMRFLETVARQGVGIFSVNQCTIERIDTGGSLRFQPNLRTECELAWITVHAPPADKIPAPVVDKVPAPPVGKKS